MSPAHATLTPPLGAARREWGVNRNVLAGTGTLTKLALRRDRLMIALWVYGITALAAGSANSFQRLYPTEASRVSFAKQIEANSGLVALTGKPYDLLTIGGLTAWRTISIGCVLAGLMSYLLVVRHSRAEEDAGRLELLAAGVVGRYAPLAAALMTALVADLGVVVLVTLGLAGQGLPVLGSLALGLAYICCGTVFAGVAAVTAQLTESPRAANGMAGAVLAVSYLLRALGDSSGPSWLGWATPIGWAERLRPYAGPDWWVLLLVLAARVVLLGAAFTLQGRRDLGAGLFAGRPGPPRAAAWLSSAPALAWRLQRAGLLGWAVGMAAFGAAAGGIADSVSNLLNGSPQLVKLLQKWGGTQGVADAYLATILGLAGIAAAAYAVQAVLRLSGEESGGRAEPLLSTPVGRLGWAGGHLMVALAGSAVLLLAVGLGAGLVSGAENGDLGHALRQVLGAALAYLPAAWVFAGIGLLLFGFRPGWTSAGWGFVVVALAFDLLGKVVGLNHWLLDLSPFTHVPAQPGAAFTWPPLLWLLLVAAGFTAAGLAALQHRDTGLT